MQQATGSGLATGRMRQSSVLFVENNTGDGRLAHAHAHAAGEVGWSGGRMVGWSGGRADGWCRGGYPRDQDRGGAYATGSGHLSEQVHAGARPRRTSPGLVVSPCWTPGRHSRVPAAATTFGIIATNRGSYTGLSAQCGPVNSPRKYWVMYIAHRDVLAPSTTRKRMRENRSEIPVRDIRAAACPPVANRS